MADGQSRPRPRPILGVYSRTWPATGDLTLAARRVADAGYRHVHIGLSSFGWADLPADITSGRLSAVRKAFHARGVHIVGVSATFNMIDPDRDNRARDIDAAIALIEAAPALGAPVISLCTGSRHPDKWTAHPDNATPAAWEDLLSTFERLIPAARRARLALGVEPDTGTIIDSVGAAERLVAELPSVTDTVGIIVDPASLVRPGEAQRCNEIVAEAFERLRGRIVAIHARDVGPAGPTPVDHGYVDYQALASAWTALPRSVPVLVHDIALDDLARTREFVARHLEATA